MTTMAGRIAGLFVAALAVASLYSGPAAAQFDRAQLQALGQINAYFNSVRTMQGEFVQIGPNGEQSEGVFFLSRPGKIRFQYRPPVRLLVISDGDTVSIEDSSAQTQDLYPLKRTPLRHLLAERIDLTSEAVVRQVNIQDDLVSIVLHEESMGDGYLTLIFDAITYELRQWIVTDAQNLTTSVAIYNTTVNTPADRQNFRIFLRSQGGATPG